MHVVKKIPFENVVKTRLNEFSFSELEMVRWNGSEKLNSLSLVLTTFSKDVSDEDIAENKRKKMSY